MKSFKIVAALFASVLISVFTASPGLAAGLDNVSVFLREKPAVSEKERLDLLASNSPLEPAAPATVPVNEKKAELLTQALPDVEAEAVNETTGELRLSREPNGESGGAVNLLLTGVRPGSPLAVADPNNETAVKAIEKNIVLYKDRLKERFSVWLERSARYVEIMKDILKDKEMPEELVFLPIVESGFNLNAYSRASAVGPWQFISATGKRYGLVIDWWRDERKDPVKSTQAAADYLKDLYRMFGSWKLALAAYNAGEGRISKALKRSGADNYWSLLNTRQIRQETKEYVPRYIAAGLIANTPEDYGFYNLAYHKPLTYEEVTLEEPVDVEVIARCAGVDVKEIRELNPELRRWSTPPNVSNYTIKIPEGTSDAFILNLAAVPENERFSVEKYKVKKGDSLKKIARKIEVPAGAITALNSVDGAPFSLKVGEIINVPPQGKYCADLDDRVSARKKVSYKKKATGKKGRKHLSVAKVKSNKTVTKIKTKAKIKTGKSKSKSI